MATSNPTHGTKVSTDPAGKQNVIREAVGPISSDSLAAESVRAGGGFAENRGAVPLAVKGENSTFTTTDTHAARELPAAVRGSDRPDTEELEPLQAGRDSYGGKARVQDEHEQRQKDEHRRPDDADAEAAAHDKGQGKEKQQGQKTGGDGDSQHQKQLQQSHHTTTATTSWNNEKGDEDSRGSGSSSSGGSGDQDQSKQSGSSSKIGDKAESQSGKQGAGQEKQQDEAAAQRATERGASSGSSQVEQGGASGGNADVAPSYVKYDVTERAIPGRPKGARLTEGGELDRAADEDAPNASFNNEIGTENDPARLAEQKILTGRAALDAQPQDGRHVGGELTDGGQYQALSADEPA